MHTWFYLTILMIQFKFEICQIKHVELVISTINELTSNGELSRISVKKIQSILIGLNLLNRMILSLTEPPLDLLEAITCFLVFTYITINNSPNQGSNIKTIGECIATLTTELNIATRSLINEIHLHNELYYVQDNPIISDYEYDCSVIILKGLMEIIKELETMCNTILSENLDVFVNPLLAEIQAHTKNTIDQIKTTNQLFVEKRINFPGSSVAEEDTRNLITHAEPMLSIENGFSDKDIEDFLFSIKRSIGLNANVELLCEPKIDGLAFSAAYKNGILVSIATRGNGIKGENITENALKISNFPKHIDLPNKSIEVRGEIFIRTKQFEKISGEFSNPRNAAAGIIRKKKSPYANLTDYIAYSLIGYDAPTQMDKISILASLGFKTQTELIVSSNMSEVKDFFEKIKTNRSLIGYEIDGIVYKVNNISMQNQLGETTKHPKWMIAHKFPEEQAVTKVLRITVQIGRTGAVTPITELEPVKIGGAIIHRSTLHNADEIEKLDIREGDLVKIKRAGDVIPKIIGLAKDNIRRENSSKFVFPSHCPVCKSKIIRDSAIFRCSGDLVCKSMLIGKLAHFTSKDAFDIVGLSEKRLEFLISKGIVSGFPDIFRILQNAQNLGVDIASCNGWGKKSLKNLISSIEQKREISLQRFIYAIGIRGIGIVNATNLASYCGSVESFINISESSSEIFFNVPGIATEKVTEIQHFFAEQKNRQVIKNLLNEVRVQTEVSAATTMLGMSVVFSGTMSIPRAEAKEVALKMGFSVQPDVSSKTTYLVVGGDPGSKLERAERLGVKVITENEWNVIVSDMSLKAARNMANS